MIDSKSAAIITAHTGYMLGDFGKMAEYAEEILKTPIWTHQFADPTVVNALHDASSEDFAGLSDKLSDQEKVVLWAFTGVSIGSPAKFREYASQLLGHEVTMAELRSPQTVEMLRDLSREDFISLDIEGE